MKSLLLALSLLLVLLAVPAGASPFSLGPGTRTLSLPKGFNHADVGLPIQPAGEGFTYENLTVSSSAGWVTPQVDVDGKRVVLKFNTAFMPVANHTATLTATHLGDVVSVTLNAACTLLNVFKLQDDPSLNITYGLHQNGLQEGSLLVISAYSGTAVRSVTVGKRPTGMAFSNNGRELFVISVADQTVSVVDLESLLVKETLTLPVFDNWNPASTSVSANVAVGPANKLYYTDASYAPVLRVLDRATNQVVQTVPSFEGQYGIGDMVLNSTKTTLYAWAQHGWAGSGSSRTYALRYAVAADGTLTLAESSLNAPFVMSRGADEAPALLSLDERLVFMKTLALPGSSVASLHRTFPGTVYSITPGGELAVTDTAIYRTSTGDRLLTLPVPTGVHAVSSDYLRLVYFNPSTRDIGIVDLQNGLGTHILEPVTAPADGSRVLQPETLDWGIVPATALYHAYFGTDRAAVESAALDSPLYLGASVLPSRPAPQGLVPGMTYYWRVDARQEYAFVKGSVHSFTVSPVSTDKVRVEATTVQGNRGCWVDVALTAAGTGTEWTATADKGWVGFSSNTGSVPGTLGVNLNAEGLAVGVHVATVTVSDFAGTLFTMPVRLTVEPLKVTHLKSQAGSARMYGISEDTVAAKAYLLEIDSAAGAILRAVPAGSSVTDLAIHEAEGRLYVPNWMPGKLLAFNKTTLALERTYPFSAFQGTGYGQNDVYRVSAGKAGRLVVEEQDQGVAIHVYDTGNGVKLGSTGAFQGGGAFDPTGRYYYHGESGVSSGRLSKLDTEGDVFTLLGRSADYGAGYGSRVVVVSEDGQSVFWNRLHFGADLTVLGTLDDIIYCTSGNGRLAFGENMVFDTSTRLPVLGMPATTKVSAFNPVTQKLVVQKGERLVFCPVSLPAAMPAPALSVGTGNWTPTSLNVAWTDESLETGFKLQYRVLGQSEWTTRNPGLVANQTTLQMNGLTTDTDYEIRIQATSPSGDSEWSNVLVARTSSVVLPTVQLNSVQPEGPNFRLSFTTTNNPTAIQVEKTASLDEPWVVVATLAGTETSWLDPVSPAGVTSYYRVTVVRGTLAPVVSAVRSVTLPVPVLGLSLYAVLDGEPRFSAANTNPYFPAVLQRRLGPEDAWADLAPLAGSLSSYLDRSGQAGATYQYRLKAGPESLTTAVSNTLTVTLPSSSPPVQPARFRFGSISASAVGLLWLDVARETGYRVDRQAGSGSSDWTLLTTLAPGAVAYTDSTVVAGVDYRYRLTAFNAEGDSPPAVTWLVRAQLLPAAMEDDFYPGVDLPQWSGLSVSGVRNAGWGFDGTACLWLGHSGARFATTKPLDTTGGGLIEFLMRAGNSIRDGTACWENSEAGEEVVLEFSTDGEAWTVLETLDTVYPSLSNWTSFALPIPPQACGSTVRFRWRQKSHSGVSEDTWALNDVRIRTTRDNFLRMLVSPEPQLVQAGEEARLEVGVNQATALFQWYKDGALLPGATQAVFSVTGAVPGNAGVYFCKVSYEEQVLDTEPVVLGVLERTGPAGTREVILGRNFDLVVRVHPVSLKDGLSFRWYRAPGNSLEGIGAVTGGTDTFLAVSGATEAADAIYYCEVTPAVGDALAVGPYAVKVLLPPVITPIPAVEGVAGSPVDIPVLTTDPAAVVRVTGLPKGLLYDAVARRIQGSTAVVKTYPVTVTASNAYGTAVPVTFQLSITGFPQNLAGAYTGVLLLVADDFKHGGRVSCQISPKGAASGTVTNRGKTYRFAAPVTAEPDGSQAHFKAPFKDASGNPLSLEVNITGGAELHPMALNVTRTGAASSESIASGKLVRNEWTVARPAPGAGIINAALRAETPAVFPAPDKPQGTGFLNLTLTARGVVTCKGRLADGQAVTGSTVMGAGGDIPVFVNLYAGKGSFGTLLSYESNLASGVAYWGKDDLGETSKDRFHKRGFVRHRLVVDGGVYVKPAVGAPLLPSLTTAPARVRLSVAAQAGLAQPLVQSLSFTAKHQADVPKMGGLNPRGVTLSLNATTGLFTGSFKLSDENPAKVGQLLQRTVSFQGALIPGQDKGCGYFLLPELPSAGVKGSSLGNTPMWSGSLELLPGWLQN